jgi:hypothetical protein
VFLFLIVCFFLDRKRLPTPQPHHTTKSRSPPLLSFSPSLFRQGGQGRRKKPARPPTTAEKRKKKKETKGKEGKKTLLPALSPSLFSLFLRPFTGTA